MTKPDPLGDAQAGNRARLEQLQKQGIQVDLRLEALGFRLDSLARALLGDEEADAIDLAVELRVGGVLDEILDAAGAARARATLLQPVAGNGNGHPFGLERR